MWMDRAVFYQCTRDASTVIAELDRLAGLGINGLLSSETRSPADAEAVERAAHRHGMRVSVGAALGIDATLEASCADYFDAHRGGDFGPFWSVFEPLHAAATADAPVALRTASVTAPPLSDGREREDLEVICTFLLTWPVVPVIREGDEAGVESHLERLIYLRATEPDLGSGAALAYVPSCGGAPLLYRRGESIAVALNPGSAAHSIELDHVGDAAPLLAHHCHLSRAGGRWTARIGPAGYGVFNVR